MVTNKNKHLYALIDQLTAQMLDELKEEDICISCHKGCSACCYLLIEVTWDEAEELVHWILQQSTKQQKQIIDRIRQHAKVTKEFLNKYRKGKKFLEPIEGKGKIPEKLFDRYMVEAYQPCPFLMEDGCAAYPHRPLPCRLHLVLSPPVDCDLLEKGGKRKVEVPGEVDEIRDEIGDIVNRIHQDERWGIFSIVLEAVLKEQGLA